VSHDPRHQPDPAAPAPDDKDAIRAALLELVLLKDMKTQHGETAEYRIRRERAWVEARRALALPERFQDL
jgi:hypothetical protein